MDDEKIKEILLERACREIESLDRVWDYYGTVKECAKRVTQCLAYADQLILLLNDFNKHLCSIEIKGALNILNQLYRRLNSGEPISDGVRQFMAAFYVAKRDSVSFPNAEIIRKTVKIAVEDDKKGGVRCCPSSG